MLGLQRLRNSDGQHLRIRPIMHGTHRLRLRNVLVPRGQEDPLRLALQPATDAPLRPVSAADTRWQVASTSALQLHCPLWVKTLSPTVMAVAHCFLSVNPFHCPML